MNRRRPTVTPRAAALLLGAALVLWTAALVAVQLGWHASLRTGGRDLGLFDHPLSNTLRGAFLASSLLPETARNYFGFHFCPVILLFLPFYALHDGPEVLLVGQVVALAAAAVPLFLIARRLTGPLQALLIALIYLCYRPVTRAAACGFHQECLFPLFILSAAYAYFVAGSRPWAWVALVLGLATKEDVSIYLLPAAALLALRPGRRRDALILAAVCVAWLVAVNRLVLPRVSSGGATEWPSHFRGYGATPLAILAAAARHPFRFLGDTLDAQTLGTIVEFLAPLGLVPLLSAFSLVAVAPAVACFLSTLELQRVLGIYYAATVFPYLFLGFCGGWRRLAAWWPARRRSWLTGLLALILLANVANSSFVQWAQPRRWRQVGLAAQARPVLDRLPAGVSVEVQNCLIPHLRPAGRRYAIFPENPAAEYVLVFPGADPWPLDDDALRERTAALLADPRVEVVAQNGACRLLRRRAAGAAP